jgi:hypothetical protein
VETIGVASSIAFFVEVEVGFLAFIFSTRPPHNKKNKQQRARRIDKDNTAPAFNKVKAKDEVLWRRCCSHGWPFGRLCSRHSCFFQNSGIGTFHDMFSPQ